MQLQPKDSSTGVLAKGLGWLTQKGLIGFFSLLAAFAMFHPLTAFAATRTASVSGNWSSTSTWGGSPVPVAGDSVVINSGVTVTVDTSTAAVTTITINAPASSNGITISGTNTLNATGAITMNTPSASATSTIAVGAGTLNAASIAFSGGAAGRANIVSLSTGSISLTGGITFGGTAAQNQLTFTGAGTLNIGGNLPTGGTFTKSTGTVNFNGLSAQTFGGYNFNTVKVNNTAGVTPTAAPTITTLTVADVTSGSVFNDGGFTISTATTLNLNDGTYNSTAAGASAFPWGTLSAGTGTVTFNLAGAQTVASAAHTFYNVTLGGSGAKTFSGTASTINGTLSMEGTATVTYTTAPTMGASSTLQYNKPASFSAGAEWQASIANLVIENTGAITSPTSGNLAVTGNMTVNSGASVTVDRQLTVSGTTNISGTSTWSSSSGTARAMTFTGDVTVNSGGNWVEDSATANDTFSFGGNLTNNATTWTGTSTGAHTFTGTTKTLSGSTTITMPSVTMTGSYTNNGTLTVATALSGAGSLTNGATGILNIGGTSGITTLTATASGNVVNYTGAAQTVKATPYDTLTLSGSGAKTMTNVSTINANLTLSGTASMTAVTSTTIGGNLTLGAGTSFTAGAFTHNIAGNWINNGATFTPGTGTINFNGTTQSIDGTATTTFNNVLLGNSGVKTFTATSTVNGTLSASSSVQIALASGTVSTANALNLGGTDEIAGTWGSSSSAATNQNDTFFSASTGYITVATGPTAGTWTGSVSTDWSVAGNWFGGSVPSSTTDVFIPSGPANQPIIGASGGLAHNITINSGATLAISSSNALILSGNWTNNGTFTANNSSVTLSGASTTIGGTGSGSFYDLALSGSASTTDSAATTASHNLTIASGTTFNTGGFALTVTGTLNLNNGGTLASSGTGTLTAGTFNLNGTYNYGSTGTQTVTNLAVASTGIYNHKSTSSALLIGSGTTSWDAASNVNVTGSFTSATNITNFIGQTFGNFTYNATGQTGTVSLVNANGTTTIQGDFNVQSTGSNTLYMRISGQIFASVIVVDGNFNLSGGTFDMHNGGATANTQEIDLYGNYNQTGGELEQDTATAGSRTIFEFKKSGTTTFTKSAGTIVSGTTVGPGIQFIVASGTTLDMGTQVMTGTNQTTFTLSAGAGIITANTNGLSTSTGSIEVNSTSTFSTAANYTYDGTANQAAGSGLPATVNSLTVNNTGAGGNNTVSLSKSETITGNLSIQAGILDLSSITTHTANALYLNGVLQPGGTWGSTASSATHKNDTYFSGTGIVTISTGVATYTVTYDGNGNTGGTVPVDASSPYNSGDSVTVLGNTGSLVKTGYTFDHWNTASDDSGTSYNPADTFTISGNVDLYAIWTPNTGETVVYDGNGNTGGTAPVDSGSYTTGDTVTVSSTADLVKTGFTFDHWNTASDDSGTSYNPADTFTITGSVTLYAIWTSNSDTVTYDDNGSTGGTVPVDASSPYNSGDTVTVLGNTGSLVKTGYTFDHWNTASDDSGTSYNPADTFTISSDTTLYAQWTANTGETVTYHGNGNTGGTAPVDSGSYTTGDTVTVSSTADLVNTGYTFAHWNTASDDSGTSYNPADTFTISGNVDLYAIWTPNTGETVVYDGNGNTGGTAPVDSGSYTTGDTVTVSSTADLVKTGFTFDHWNTASDDSGTSYNPADTFTITGSVTLYAIWTSNSDTVTYDGNGNTGGTVPVDASSPYNSGDTVTVLGNTGSLVKTGYTFNDWNTASDGSGTSYSPSDTFTISSDTTLYAQWTANTGETVTYDDNGSTGGTVPVDGGSYTTGDTVTVLGNTGSLVKTGNSFTGWNTASNGSGTSYSPADTFTISGNVTLYAQWNSVAAPILSAIVATPSSNSSGITWTSNTLSSSKVIYSPDTSYASTTAELDTSPRVTSHSMSLLNLVSCTLYHFEVVSRDSVGNSSTSTDQTFTTSGCAGGAAVTGMNSGYAATSTGATVTLTNGSDTFTADLPAGFSTTSSVEIQISSLNGPPVIVALGSPTNYSTAGNNSYNVEALIDSTTLLESFDAPVTITIHYSNADVSGLDENSLWIYRNDGGSWVALDSCVVDTASNTITCTTSHFSVFTLFGRPVTVSSGGGGGGGGLTGNGGDGLGLPTPTTSYQIYYNGQYLTMDQYNQLIGAAGTTTIAQVTSGTSTAPTASGAMCSIDPSNLQNLLASEGLTENVSLENTVLTQVYADAKQFGLTLTTDEAMAIRNFIVYGNSPATIKLGEGERRALVRDYMDTVNRAAFVWCDVERIATGQIPLVRNLKREQQQEVSAEPVYKLLFGHDPNFQNPMENLAWNTFMYRIRFPRDLTKEAAGGKLFSKAFGHVPTTPFGWSVVRVLGYVKK